MWAANYISAENSKVGGGKADPGVSSLSGQEGWGTVISDTTSGGGSVERS